MYVDGHAFVKAARLHSVNETWLHGRVRRLPVTGVIFTAAALGLPTCRSAPSWARAGLTTAPRRHG
ncbi:MAG TPA: hypothetical protein VNV62_11210 [Trebonia sp.]|nr:hypothetical protein [Trebonia sp.]